VLKAAIHTQSELVKKNIKKTVGMEISQIENLHTISIVRDKSKLMTCNVLLESCNLRLETEGF
jgi:hypothetical protein